VYLQIPKREMRGLFIAGAAGGFLGFAGGVASMQYYSQNTAKKKGFSERADAPPPSEQHFKSNKSPREEWVRCDKIMENNMLIESSNVATSSSNRLEHFPVFKQSCDFYIASKDFIRELETAIKYGGYSKLSCNPEFGLTANDRLAASFQRYKELYEHETALINNKASRANMHKKYLEYYSATISYATHLITTFKIQRKSTSLMYMLGKEIDFSAVESK